jgi:hypothetical protein
MGATHAQLGHISTLKHHCPKFSHFLVQVRERVRFSSLCALNVSFTVHLVFCGVFEHEVSSLLSHRLSSDCVVFQPHVAEDSKFSHYEKSCGF